MWLWSGKWIVVRSAAHTKNATASERNEEVTVHTAKQRLHISSAPKTGAEYVANEHQAAADPSLR